MFFRFISNSAMSLASESYLSHIASKFKEGKSRDSGSEFGIPPNRSSYHFSICCSLCWIHVSAFNSNLSRSPERTPFQSLSTLSLLICQINLISISFCQALSSLSFRIYSFHSFLILLSSASFHYHSISSSCFFLSRITSKSVNSDYDVVFVNMFLPTNLSRLRYSFDFESMSSRDLTHC